MSKITKAVAMLGVVAGLGVAALPLSTYAAVETVPVKATVDGSLSITVSAPEVNVGNVVPGGKIAYEDLSVTVKTNADATATGYDLKIRDSDSITALVGASANIPAGVPSDTTSASAWGYATVNATSGVVSAYKAVTVADAAITGTPLNNGSATTVLRFGVTAAEGLAEGTYTGGVILTATAK